jgi:hypothetical protein
MSRIMGGTRCGFFGYGNVERQHPTGHIIRDKGEGKQQNPALVNSQKARMHGDQLEDDSDSFVFRRHPACYTWNTSKPGDQPIAGTIGQPANDTCRYGGQMQLGAMALSNGGTPHIKTFQTTLNHSVVFTLRITANQRGSVFELLQSDGATLIERVTHVHRFCHNFALGRNIGLSRLPLPGSKALDPTCTLVTPIETCYGSDPKTWGTNRLWRRNSASHAPLPSYFNPLEIPLETQATSSGVRCQIPFCTPGPSDEH